MAEQPHSPSGTRTGYRLMSLSPGYYAIPAVVYNRMFRANKTYLAIIVIKAMVILFLSLTHGGIQCLT